MERRNPVLEESSYPLPSTAQIVLVTPEMASDWLSHRSYDRNRRLSKAVVGKYIQDMRGGRWKTTRQGLIFDTEGKLIDGQHRLSAVANSEVTVAFWIYPDEPRDTFEVLDQNFRRQASHLLAVPNATTVAAGARYLAALSDGDQWDMPRFNRVTTPEVLSVVANWPELTRLAKQVMDIRLLTWITGSPHLAVLAQAARTEYGTPERFEEWFAGLRNGAGLEPGDPRLHLRNRFMVAHNALTGSKNRNQVYALIAKSWNNFAEGKPTSVLRWMASEPLPPVAGYAWPTPDENEEN